MNQLKPFDYFSSSVGFLGTMLILGTFGEVPKPFIVFSGIISALLCLLSDGAVNHQSLFPTTSRQLNTGCTPYTQLRT